jgi:hypothetical protein
MKKISSIKQLNAAKKSNQAFQEKIAIPFLQPQPNAAKIVSPGDDEKEPKLKSRTN